MNNPVAYPPHPQLEERGGAIEKGENKRETKLKEEKEVPEGEDSLENVPDSEAWRKLIDGKSYKSRNVCKSLIRNIYSYIRKNREDIVRILSGAHYTMKAIDRTFFKIGCYIEKERQKRGKKSSQSTIKKMLVKKTAFTYILRETLHAVLRKWSVGDYGKISRANIAVYKEACESFYQQAVQVLAEPAQGTSFEL